MVLAKTVRPGNAAPWRSTVATHAARAIEQYLCGYFNAREIDHLDIDLVDDVVTVTNLVDDDDVVSYDDAELVHAVRTYQYMHRVATATK